MPSARCDDYHRNALRMTNPSVLLELAGRVEALQQADRTVDVLIAVAVDWRWPDWEEGEATARGQAEKHGIDWLIERCVNGYASMWRHMPEYTRSIDAAMTLVGAKWRLSLSESVIEDVPPWEVVLIRRDAEFARAKKITVAGHTLPTTLTAACLRALAAREG